MKELEGEIIEVTDKGPYIIRVEEVDCGEPELSKFRGTYNKDGIYIGDEKRAEWLCNELGIEPEPLPGCNQICSIGFCEKEQKWYGWSHRAIYGFGVGDVVKEDDLTSMSGYTDEYLKEHPEKDRSLPVGFTAKTLDDAKRMAIAFAESVA